MTTHHMTTRHQAHNVVSGEVAGRLFYLFAIVALVLLAPVLPAIASMHVAITGLVAFGWCTATARASSQLNARVLAR